VISRGKGPELRNSRIVGIGVQVLVRDFGVIAAIERCEPLTAGVDCRFDFGSARRDNRLA
jgi:hypothetical protein